MEKAKGPMRKKKERPVLAWAGLLIAAGSLTMIAYGVAAATLFADQPRFPLLVSLTLTIWPLVFAAHTFLTPSSLKIKLVSAFLLISLLPIGLLSLLDQAVTFQALSENSKQAISGAASRTATAIDNFIYANLATVRTEAMIPQFAKLLSLPPSRQTNSAEEKAAMGILISLKRRDQTNITSIALLNKEGVSIADTYGTDLGSDKSDRDYFTHPMKTGLPFVSSVHFTGTSNQPSVYFSCPVRNTTGQILGLLRVRYNASVLQGLISSINGMHDSDFSAVLFDEAGIRLADSRRPDLTITPAFPLDRDSRAALRAQHRLPEGKIRQVWLDRDIGILDESASALFRGMLHGPETGPTLNMKTALRSTDWTLVLGYSEAANRARINAQSINALLLVLGITLAVIFGSILITRKITGPLLRLTRAAHSISLGQEDVKVPHESNDEIGELASTFNSMSQALRDSRQNLIASSERLKTLLDTLPDAVFVHDETGTVLSVNQSFQSLFGRPPEDVTGISLEELSGEGLTLQMARQRIRQTVEKGALEFEWVARHKNGTETPVYARLRRLDLPEGIRIMAVVSDITDRKIAENAMLRAQEDLETKVAERTRELREANVKLRQLDKLKSAFLSSASHELRTPLTSVLGFAKLAGKSFQKNFLPLAGSDKKLQHRGQVLLGNLQVIESEGSRLARLVNDLLDLNKIESGKIEWHDEQIDLAEELDQAVKTMTSEFSAKPKVKIEFDVDTAPPKIIADRDRIRQVLLNLLSNAVKFTAEGFIRITIKPLAAGGVEVRVRDSGPGITATDLDKIFEKFYQAPPTRPNLVKVKGTGLGLSICRQIVEHYGGRIWAESSQGRGATFIFQLPGTRPQSG